MQSANDLGQERRDRQHLDLLPRRRGVEPEGGNRVGDHQPVERRIADRLFRARHEQTVRHHRQHAAGAGLTRRPRGADERGAGADQIVDDERGRARDLADEKVARYDAGAAVLFGKTLPDRFAARFFQRLAEKLRTLGPARVR